MENSAYKILARHTAIAPFLLTLSIFTTSKNKLVVMLGAAQSIISALYNNICVA
jgi:hypothetical protein